MFQNILLAEYHGTFHGTPKQQDASTCFLTFKTSLYEHEQDEQVWMTSPIYVFP
jgi:hypothetical protein